MPENIAELSANGGQPEVEIVIGQLQRGDHSIILLDRNGENGVIVGETNNGIPVAYRYQIPKPLSALDGSELRWNCIIGTMSGGEENASATVRIIQDDQVVSGGTIVTRKKIDGLGLIDDKVRLNVSGKLR